MGERPILFSPAMVRAILAGRKTQTRRLVTVPWKGATRSLPYEPYWVDNDGVLEFCDEYGDYHPWVDWSAPFGKAGDRLWVREGWRPTIAHGCGQDTCDCAAVNVHYLADKSMRFFPEDAVPDTWNMPKAASRGKAVTSLYMPRWAARLVLEITGIRVQRLNDITEEDARAEGIVSARIHADEDGPERIGYTLAPDDGKSLLDVSPCDTFRKLWDSLNADRAPWSSNPWVWAISFARPTPEERSEPHGKER